MTNSLLQEYKDYYKVRADRFAGNPNYKYSFQAETDLSNAMQSCGVLEEFKDKAGNLNEKCANALIKDSYIMRKSFYEEMQEDVRILAPQRILESVDQKETALDVASFVAEEENKNSIEISMDESHRELVHAWKQLDEIEIYENADVPAKYKSDMLEIVNDAKKSLKESVEHLEENNKDWQNDWRIIPEKVLEFRHISKLPYKKEHIEEQLQKYKTIINR